MTTVNILAVRSAPDLATLRDTLGLDASQSLVFVAADGEQEFVIDSDLALRVAAKVAGHVEIAACNTSSQQAPSVSAAFRNMMAALVHTASRPPSPPLVAALLRSNIPAASSFPPPSPPRSNSPTRSVTPPPPPSLSNLDTESITPTLNYIRPTGSTTPPSMNMRAHRGTRTPPSRPRSPSRSTSPRNAEHRIADACFCTHWGAYCSSCTISPIRGIRYECGAESLCERCRREYSRSTSLTVYEHPWEADASYESAHVEDLRAPAAPLEVGDRGPRVVHLHYVLYTLGYLFLLAPGFEHDSFTDVTRRAIARFQSDCMVNDEAGAYRAATRAAVLVRAEMLERIRGTCRSNATSRTAENPRMRLRSALAA